MGYNGLALTVPLISESVINTSVRILILSNALLKISILRYI